MAWVRFDREFWWRATPQASIRYRSGSTYNVPRSCADKAIADGAATRTSNPRKVRHGATDHHSRPRKA